jgi:hypothetical protein
MSGLCLRPPRPSREKTGLNHFFYPQSYPQEHASQKRPFSRHRLFYEAKSHGKLRLRCALWKTTMFEESKFEYQLRLIMTIDCAFVGA